MDGIMGEPEANKVAVVYEKLWRIPDWVRDKQNRDTLEAQILEFETGEPSGFYQTKWAINFGVVQQEGRISGVHFYWKLVEAKGFPDGRVQVGMTSTLLHRHPIVDPTIQREVMYVGDRARGVVLWPLLNWSDFLSPRVNYHGNGMELVFKLKLEIMEPVVPPTDLSLEMFHKACSVQVLANFGSILGDKDTADLKIVTSDGKELLAHKAILKAQCPVFESMFRSDFSENKTGVVNVKDVSAKTMGILLHLFYTGKLLPSWKDPDTVVEFTYAAGKYQLTNVLKLLDEALGGREEVNAFQIDVQLLDLAQKLDLKTAEKMLLVRIKKAICEVNSGEEFFKLYGYQRD